MPNLPKIAVSPNLTKRGEGFWQRMKNFAALPNCPPSFHELFQALFHGKTILLEPTQAAVFLELLEGIEGWDNEADPLACPVLFSVAADQVPCKDPIPNTPSHTAQVLDLRDGEVLSLPLSGEVFGLCVSDSHGTLILSAPPGLPIQEIQKRMANMTGDLSSASLVPGPMASLPDGAFFAVLLPGGNKESLDARNYVLYQMLGKNGRPPQPPQRPWEA
jgi:hypothetical protein